MIVAVYLILPIKIFLDNASEFKGILKVYLTVETDHVHNWLGLFVFMHNADILHIKFMKLVRLMRGGRFLTRRRLYKAC